MPTTRMSGSRPSGRLVLAGPSTPPPSRRDRAGGRRGGWCSWRSAWWRLAPTGPGWPVVVAGLLEGCDLGRADHAAVACHDGGKMAQGLQLGVGDGTAFAHSGDVIFADSGNARQVGVACHAVGALVLVDDREVGDVALHRAEAGLLGDAQ